MSALTEGIGLESGATDVPFDAKSYGESSYYVTAVLEPGEYAIYTDVNKNTMSTFRCE